MKRTCLAFCVLGTLLLVAACGDDEPPPSGQDLFQYPDWGTTPTPDTSSGCNASNCNGCCRVTASGTSCVSGTTNDACGYGGLNCLICSNDQKCQAGVCSGSKCDATSCKDGCCDSNGKCVSPATNNSCGAAGAKCVQCASGETCIKGACKDESKVDYEIILVSASKVKGYTCDTWGVCDYYVKLTVGNQSGQSSVKADTDSPTWNETLINSAKGSDIIKKFEGKVYDEDVAFDQWVGDCKPTVTTKDLAAGTLKVDCGNYSSMGFLKTVVVTFKFKAK